MTQPDGAQTVSDDELPTAGGKGDTIAPGRTIGRYVVLSKLGAGGMGVVYAAYDPELDRKVAVKLLRVDEGPSLAADKARARLLREAQALARLGHPNVVTVHDAGSIGDQVFIAMELVDGQTLGQWSRERPRTWREAIDVVIAAARGVVAAHDAGLLHRDLKPDNIMVGRDGRVRVMDLGLVRELRRADTTEASTAVVAEATSSTGETSRSALAVELTRAGAVLGTPAYMAPEQHVGVECTASADQFSLCVTAWELVYGERPFAGDSLATIAFNVAEGRIRTPPRGRAPSWVATVLRRGLVADREARWPSVARLIAELERGQARVVRRNLFAGLGVVAVATVSIVGYGSYDHNRRIHGCEVTGERIDEVWNDDVRKKLRVGLASAGVPGARVSAEKVMPWIDRHAEAWREAASRTCLDEVEARVDQRTSERARFCLDERRRELSALLGELGRGGPAAAERAVGAAASLRSPSVCLDAEMLARLPPPPVDQVAEIQDLGAMLSRVSALHRAGNYPESVALGREALEQAKVLDWPPLVARAELELGTALDRTAEYEESETMLEDAFFSAGPAGAVDVAAEAALQLILSTGERQGRPKDALRWARHAEDALERLGERDGRRMATLTAYRGRTQLALGDTDAAQALYVRALELIEDAVGFDHPDVASTLTTYAGVQYARGDYAGAKASLDRALSITESALGPDHPSIGAVLNNLAAISELLGDREAALAHYERAIAISERNLGPDHPTVATLITNLASFHHSSGDAARAEPLLRRALAVRAKTGVEDAVLASTLDSLGYVLDTLDQDEEATETFQRSLALREKLVGADDPTLAYPLLGLASIALTSGHAHEAIPLAERAVALRDRPDIGRDLLALARATLGRALFESGTDRTRGIALVEEAHTTIVAMGTAPDGTSPETLERWLAEHRPPEPQPSR